MRKLRAMSCNHLPKLCYHRLLTLSEDAEAKYNWVTQVKKCIEICGGPNGWNNKI